MNFTNQINIKVWINEGKLQEKMQFFDSFFELFYNKTYLK